MSAAAPLRQILNLSAPWPRWLTWLVVGLIGAPIVGFYFALSGASKFTLRVPYKFRVVSLVTALIFAAIMVPDAIRTTRFWGAYVLARNPITLGLVSSLGGVISNFAYIGLLIALFRSRGDMPSTSSDVPPSRTMRFLTKATVIVIGTLVGCVMLSVAALPFIYSSTAELVAQLGHRMPPLRQMYLDGAPKWLGLACLWIVPFVVYNSWPPDE